MNTNILLQTSYQNRFIPSGNSIVLDTRGIDLKKDRKKTMQINISQASVEELAEMVVNEMMALVEKDLLRLNITKK